MGYEATTVETARLRLRSLRMSDRDAILDAFTSAVTTFMTPESAQHPRETEAFLASAIERMSAGTDLVCAITMAGDSRFLGCVGVHELDHGRPSLGIWIREDAWGKGYGLEAVAGLRDWASAVTDVEAFDYPVDERNGPSRRIAEDLGGEVVQGPTPSTTARGRTLHILRYSVPPRTFPRT